jgi:hypothetical protein
VRTTYSYESLRQSSTPNELTDRKLLLTFLLAETPALPWRISMSEPTKKELLARIAELRTRLAPEKQAR